MSRTSDVLGINRCYESTWQLDAWQPVARAYCHNCLFSLLAIISLSLNLPSPSHFLIQHTVRRSLVSSITYDQFQNYTIFFLRVLYNFWRSIDYAHYGAEVGVAWAMVGDDDSSSFTRYSHYRTVIREHEYLSNTVSPSIF